MDLFIDLIEQISFHLEKIGPYVVWFMVGVIAGQIF